MKKIGKKRILGIALLTSLSIFAGTTIAANNSSRTAKLMMNVNRHINYKGTATETLWMKMEIS